VIVVEGRTSVMGGMVVKLGVLDKEIGAVGASAVVGSELL